MYIVLSANVSRDFPLTAISIARQCGIIRNQRVDDIKDLALELTTPIAEYNFDDPQRICKSIALTGKDLPAMTDSQWHQVMLACSPLIVVMPV
jgi:magnesium-transporting ATPase (P-type)